MAATIIFHDSGTKATLDNTPHIDEIKGEISLYKGNGNSNVYQYMGRSPNGLPIVGRFLRTDYRS